MALACALYTGSWLTTNFFVILIMMFAVSMVFLLSRLLPTQTKAKLTGLVRGEIFQIMISIFIIAALLAVTSTVCSAAGYVAQQVNTAPGTVEYGNGGIPFPALGQPTVPLYADPFVMAESYVGYYAFNSGPSLAAQQYATSYSFSITSGLWQAVGSILEGAMPNSVGKDISAKAVQVQLEVPVMIDLGVPYGILSDMLIDVLSPLVMIGIGIMLFQYVLLVVSEMYAFSVILPIALVLRSLAFTSGTLKSAANAMLVIAIAMYIIYPVMVVFDSYGLNWIFSSCATPVACNPSSQYLLETYSTAPPPNFQGISAPCILSLPSLTGTQCLFSASSLNPGSWFLYLAKQGYTLINYAGYNTSGLTTDVQFLTLETAEYLFTVIVLFAVNLVVVVGFSMGMAKALNGGVEGAANFWSGL